MEVGSQAACACQINDHEETGSSSVAAAVLDQPRCPSVPTPQLGWSIGRVVAGVTAKEGQTPCMLTECQLFEAPG